MRSPAVLAIMLAAIFYIAPLCTAQMAVAGQDGLQNIYEVQQKADGPFLTSENIYVNRTCSGERAMPYPKIYVFGMRDDIGGCATRTFTANSYEEALGCAEKACQNCEIEDLTWLNEFSSSTQGVDAIRGYCPSRNR